MDFSHRAQGTEKPPGHMGNADQGNNVNCDSLMRDGMGYGYGMICH